MDNDLAFHTDYELGTDWLFFERKLTIWLFLDYDMDTDWSSLGLEDDDCENWIMYLATHLSPV